MTDFDSVFNLIANPIPEFKVVRVQPWYSFEEWEQPRQMAKEANALHICMQLLQNIGFLPINKHIKGFSEGKIAHDIETIVIEPICHVHGHPEGRFDRSD